MSESRHDNAWTEAAHQDVVGGPPREELGQGAPERTMGPASWSEPVRSAAPQPTVTSISLGRIVLGVFLGFFLALLAWTAVLALIMVGLAATAFNLFENAVDDVVNDRTSSSSDGSSLSAPCQALLDAGIATGNAAEAEDAVSSPACAGDNPAEILRYLNSQ